MLKQTEFKHVLNFIIYANIFHNKSLSKKCEIYGSKYRKIKYENKHTHMQAKLPMEDLQMQVSSDQGEWKEV